jgi:hypothetical protein
MRAPVPDQPYSILLKASVFKTSIVFTRVGTYVSTTRMHLMHFLQDKLYYLGVRVKYGDDGDDGDDGVVVNFNGHISVVYPL